MILRKLTIALLASAAMVTMAGAADMAVKAPMIAPVPPVTPPLVNWNGFYFFGDVGGSWGNFTSTDDIGNSTSFSDNGLIWGGGVGVNWVAPGTNFLVGLELDANQFDNGKTNSNVVDGRGDVIGVLTGQEDFVATARARVGVTWNEWLFYATGGGAYGQGSAFTTFNNGVVSPTFREPGVGWTVGAGIDYMPQLTWFGSGHFFVGVLYLYTDLTGLNDSLGGNDRFTSNSVTGRFGWKF